MTHKTLTRTMSDKWIAGVCGGVAEYTGLDASLVRIITLVAFVLGAGSLGVIYLIMWVLVPRDDVTPGPRATPPPPPPPSA